MLKIFRSFIYLLVPAWLLMFLMIFFITLFLYHLKTPFFMTIGERVVFGDYIQSAKASYEVGGINNLKKWVGALSKIDKINLGVVTGNTYKLSFDYSVMPIKPQIEFCLNDEGYTISEDGNYILSDIIAKTPTKIIRLVADRARLNNLYISKTVKTIQRVALSFITALVLTLIVLFTIYKKVRTIRRSVSEIQKGNFSPINKAKAQKDEVSLLFNDVFEMSATIKRLIDSKNRLLQDISHELRSPLARQLTAIAIAKKKLDSITLEDVDKIEKENTKLEELVSELLEFSMSNRTKTLMLEKVCLNDLVLDLIQAVNFEFQTNCIKMKSPKVINVTIDSGLFYRALENILRNAVKYGGTKKEILISFEQLKKGQIEIIIDDQGPGVPESEINCLFEPFYRINNPHTDKSKGYGLGLAIAKEIIELHQGTIEVFNRSEGGLRFILRMSDLSVY